MDTFFNPKLCSIQIPPSLIDAALPLKIALANSGKTYKHDRHVTLQKTAVSLPSNWGNLIVNHQLL